MKITQIPPRAEMRLDACEINRARNQVTMTRFIVCSRTIQYMTFNVLNRYEETRQNVLHGLSFWTMGSRR